jgi:hypothetical protein
MERKGYKVLVGTPEGKDLGHVEDQGVERRIMLKRI